MRSKLPTKKTITDSSVLVCPFTLNNPDQDMTVHYCKAEQCLAWESVLAGADGYCKLIERN